MDEDTATFSVTVTANVQLPSGSDQDLASQIVANALRTDGRIYLVVEHADRVLAET